VGIVHTTPEGKVLYQNPSAQKMWGYSAQELSELNASVFYVHPEDHTELVNNLKEKGEHSFEYQLRRKGGQVFWGRGITKASQDKHGEVVYQGILEDITARQRAEEELRRSEEKFSKLDTPEFGVM
jgi:PAS domain S-box-containing protein